MKNYNNGLKKIVKFFFWDFLKFRSGYSIKSLNNYRKKTSHANFITFETDFFITHDKYLYAIKTVWFIKNVLINVKKVQFSNIQTPASSIKLLKIKLILDA